MPALHEDGIRTRSAATNSPRPPFGSRNSVPMSPLRRAACNGAGSRVLLALGVLVVLAVVAGAMVGAIRMLTPQGQDATDVRIGAGLYQGSVPGPCPVAPSPGPADLAVPIAQTAPAQGMVWHYDYRNGAIIDLAVAAVYDRADNRCAYKEATIDVATHQIGIPVTSGETLVWVFIQTS